MSDNSVEVIKKEDKKSFKKFMVILAVSTLVGFLAGIGSAMLEGNVTDTIAEIALTFFEVISPYASLVISAVVTLISIVIIRKCKREYKQWNQEEEEVIDRIETQLSYPLVLSNIAMILGCFFFAVATTMNISISNSTVDGIRLVISFVGFIFTMVVITLIQKDAINLEKEINPEKKGSIYDTNFAKKWEESCDEAEKLAIYKCAYKSYQSVSMTCLILWLACLIGATVWNIGIVPVAIVTIIWLVQTMSYCIESIRYGKKEKK